MIDPQHTDVGGNRDCRSDSERDLAEAPSDPGNAVDVVVPVFEAADDLDRCLESVLRHTRFPPNRLVLVVDGPQGKDVEAVVRRRLEEDSSDMVVLRNQVRDGFVKSVNRGMAVSDRDVVLLNSDTVVTPRWLDKLRFAAHSEKDVATVTPLSNNATICSLPEFLEENLLPAGFTVDEVAAVIERVAERTYPHLPTGVGVCLYIRRRALEEVGPFDSEAFGLGYGEENEFCIRATRAGFVHIADDATFIFHAGQGSFGGARSRLVKRAMRRLRKIDRSYLPRVASFIRSDPLEPMRARVLERVLERQGLHTGENPDQGLSILHVVHGWPPFDVGGTEQYARRLALHQTCSHRVSAFVRIAEAGRSTGQRMAYLDHGIRVRLVVNNFDQRSPLARNAMRDGRFERELVDFIADTAPDVVHVHHLAGHSASLMGVISRLGLPIVYQVQDWWALCARANLWHADNRLCPGPTPARCAACLPLTGLSPRSSLNRALYFARNRVMKRALRNASSYVMGSASVREWHTEAGMFAPGVPVHVLDYGVETPERRQELGERRTGPLTFGFIGALMPHKGAHVAVEAFRDIDGEQARLRIWGNPGARPDYSGPLMAAAAKGAVEFCGVFDDSERAEILASIDVLIVPSVGLESYGIVAREAMAAGVPVIVARRGALEELVADGGCGAAFDPDHPEELTAILDRVISRPTIVNSWRLNLPPLTTLTSHAAAIDAVYREVVEPRH